MKKRFTAGVLAAAMVVSMVSIPPAEKAAADTQGLQEVVLRKSTGNPMLGFDDETSVRYAGDPSIMVDGDTVCLCRL